MTPASSSIQAACDNLAPIKTGEAVITQGFKLPAKYIIHAAGPVWRGGKQGEETLLRSCYINSLELAVKHNCVSIAFPLISSGIYGYPKADALGVATAAIKDFLSGHDIAVSLVVFDKEAFSVIVELLGAVKSYIDEHYIEERHTMRRELLDVEMKALAAESATVPLMSDASGKKDAEVYRRANIALLDAIGRTILFTSGTTSKPKTSRCSHDDYRLGRCDYKGRVLRQLDSFRRPQAI